MSYRGWVMCLASLGIAAGIFAAVAANSELSRSAVAEEASKPAGPPPLVVDTSSPLLLGTPAPEVVDPFAIPAGPMANNSSCYVCHTNYEEEEFVVQHAKANVGCIKCHGQSFAHRDDEDNITPPDILYPQEKIAKNCADCHDTHDAPAAKVIALWQERCSAKNKPEDLLCTDCHGQHRLKIRNVRWDKTTRALIIGAKSDEVKATEDSTQKEPDEKAIEAIEAMTPAAGAGAT